METVGLLETLAYILVIYPIRRGINFKLRSFYIFSENSEITDKYSFKIEIVIRLLLNRSVCNPPYNNNVTCLNVTNKRTI